MCGRSVFFYFKNLPLHHAVALARLPQILNSIIPLPPFGREVGDLLRVALEEGRDMSTF